MSEIRADQGRSVQKLIAGWDTYLVHDGLRMDQRLIVRSESRWDLAGADGSRSFPVPTGSPQVAPPCCETENSRHFLAVMPRTSRDEMIYAAFHVVLQGIATIAAS